MENQIIIQECADLKNKFLLTNNDIFNLVQENHSFVSLKTIDRFFQSDCKIKPSDKTVQTIHDALIKYNDKNGYISKDVIINKQKKEIIYLKEQIIIKNHQIDRLMGLLEKGKE